MAKKLTLAHDRAAAMTRKLLNLQLKLSVDQGHTDKWKAEVAEIDHMLETLHLDLNALQVFNRSNFS